MVPVAATPRPGIALSRRLRGDDDTAARSRRRAADAKLLAFEGFEGLDFQCLFVHHVVIANEAVSPVGLFAGEDWYARLFELGLNLKYFLKALVGVKLFQKILIALTLIGLKLFQMFQKFIAVKLLLGLFQIFQMFQKALIAVKLLLGNEVSQDGH